MSELAPFIASHPLITLLILTGAALLCARVAWTALSRLRAPMGRWTARGWTRLAALPIAHRLMQRHGWLRPPATHDARALALDLAAGWVLVITLMSLFLGVADEMGLDETLGRFDDRLAAALRLQLTSETLRTFAWLTHLGDPEVLAALGLIVGARLLWQGQRGLAMCWIAALAGNGILNRTLKALFERSRPLHEHGWALEPDWSFPSGHASGAAVTYGMLAYLWMRQWRGPPLLLPVAIMLILVVGYSRIVLQVHYVSDVIAGYLSGGAWLIVCIGTAEVLRLRRRPSATVASRCP